MKDGDFGKFSQLWDVSQEIGINGKVFTKNALEAIFDMFLEYDIKNIEGALIEFRKINKFAPTPACILEVLKKHKPRQYYQASKQIASKPIHLIEYLKDRK